jgi:glycosyltransferase involved in cell wall biosynthesis
MKRIVIQVSSNLSPNSRGAEAHTLVSIVNILKNDFIVDIVGTSNLPNDLSSYVNIKGRKVSFSKNRWVNIFKTFEKILNLYVYCKQSRPEVLFNIGGIGTNALAIVLVGKLLKIPTVVRSAGYSYGIYKIQNNKIDKIFSYVKQNILASISFRYSTFIMVVGSSLKLQYTKDGIRKDKMFVIPGPLRWDDFYPIKEKSTVKNNLMIPSNKKIILYAGGLDYEKGVKDLIKLINDLDDKNFHFIVIGKQMYNDNYESFFLKDHVNVTYLGVIPHNEMFKFYNAADLFVFLTKIGGGYGQVNLEAMMCEVPILSIDYGLDVAWLLGDNACKDYPDLLSRIKNNEYKSIPVPSDFKPENLNKKYINFFNQF